MQKQHWEKMLEINPEMFDDETSDPARNVAELFEKEGRMDILKFGGRQTRDTTFFACFKHLTSSFPLKIIFDMPV